MDGEFPAFEKWEAIVLVVFLSIAAIGVASTLGFPVIAEMAALLGFAVVLPLVGFLGHRLPFVETEPGDEADPVGVGTSSGGRRDRTETPESVGGSDESDTPVANLRERYARGEIDDAEFERRLERLLETEDLDETVDAGSGRIPEPE